MGRRKEDAKATPTWTKANVPNLYRHRNGRYYARVFVGGKEIWKTLKTKLKSIAVNRLQEHVDTAREQRESGILVSDGKFTFSEALKIYREKVEKSQDIKPRTKNYRKEAIVVILKTWPGIGEIPVRKISTTMIKEWAFKLKTGPASYKIHKAKAASKIYTGTSASKVNGAIDVMKYTLDMAVESGHLFKNPARDNSIKRAKPKPKRLTLPSREQVQAIFESVDKSAHRASKAAGEMVRFLAYTGGRITECRHIECRDIDFIAGRITFRVTKNGHARDVPMIPECRHLLEQMRKQRPDEDVGTPILQLKKFQKTLTTACKQVGAPRMTHHDLRHVFATTAIESGMDIPTVAKIMGHLDGGALAMKVYGHLRDEHAQASMLKMRFGPPSS